MTYLNIINTSYVYIVYYMMNLNIINDMMGHYINADNFDIIFSSREWEIKLAESIKVHEFKPSLNDMMSSTPLNIL